MFCKYCGQEIIEEGKFCGSCGKEIISDEKVLSPVQEPENQVIIKKESHKLSIILTAVITLLLLTGLTSTQGFIFSAFSMGSQIKELVIISDKNTIEVGEEMNLAVKAKKMNNNEINALDNIQWSCQNPSIISISKDGKIKGLKPGSTKVQAIYKNYIAEVPINVSGKSE